jgi:hypothetical protein
LWQHEAFNHVHEFKLLSNADNNVHVTRAETKKWNEKSFELVQRVLVFNDIEPSPKNVRLFCLEKFGNPEGYKFEFC